MCFPDSPCLEAHVFGTSSGRFCLTPYFQFPFDRAFDVELPSRTPDISEAWRHPSSVIFAVYPTPSVTSRCKRLFRIRKPFFFFPTRGEKYVPRRCSNPNENLVVLMPICSSFFSSSYRSNQKSIRAPETGSLLWTSLFTVNARKRHRSFLLLQPDQLLAAPVFWYPIFRVPGPASFSSVSLLFAFCPLQLVLAPGPPRPPLFL